MQKIKLLIADSGFVQPWFLSQWQRFFDCVIYEPGQTYSADHVALVDKRYEPEKYQHLQAQGHRIVGPYLMDSVVHEPSEITPEGDLILRAQEAVWIMEYLTFEHRGYNTTRPAQTPHKFFLLLINRLRDHRARLLTCVEPYLQDSLYTCVTQGIMLEDDVFEPGISANTTANDRHYVPRWYGETCFSLVSETTVQFVTGPGLKPRTQGLFVSEKSFKPLAHSHAFVTQGCTGTLAYLRGLGFETFGHVLDESYDQEPNQTTRLQMVMDQLQLLHSEFKSTGTLFQDPRSQQILQHNQQLFFDQARVDQLFQDQIAQPIMEWAETR
jgi:hypothetical protein